MKWYDNQGNGNEVENLETGKFPKILIKGQYDKPWALDWKGDGDMPTKGSLIKFQADKKDGRFWFIDEWEYINGCAEANTSEPERLSDILSNLPELQKTIKTHDERQLSIVLQCIIKSTTNTEEADKMLKWYFRRLTNPQAVFDDSQS